MKVSVYKILVGVFKQLHCMNVLKFHEVKHLVSRETIFSVVEFWGVFESLLVKKMTAFFLQLFAAYVFVLLHLRD